jgi:hypothetical protein
MYLCKQQLLQFTKNIEGEHTTVDFKSFEEDKILFFFPIWICYLDLVLLPLEGEWLGSNSVDSTMNQGEKS